MIRALASAWHRAWIPVLLVALGIAALPVLLLYDRPRGVAMNHIRETGRLRVLTIDSPTTFYEGPESPLGLEYDLAKGFADRIGAELVIETADSVAALLPRLVRGDADFAAAGLKVNQERARLVRFTPPYQSIRHQVVYLRGGRQPKTIEDLIGREIQVVAGSSVAQRLSQLKVDHPDLTWSETSDEDAERLLYDVWQKRLDLTIADSNLVAVTRQYYPHLNVGFTIDGEEQLAWAFAPTRDYSVYGPVSAYLKELSESGELDRLIERYYGTADSFNYINVSRFRRSVASLLPKLKGLFEQAEEKTGIDWRLLAAQAYQESQWDPDAVSPTGVKGIMQLTQDTADQLGIQDRRDPAQSILGGARYLKRMIGKIPSRIQEPDRTWLALGAYNIGFGHLEDARILTQRAGKSPDKWADVKEFLPLLSDPEWYEKTKYGEAPGQQALSFVTRVRTFYNVLVKMDTEQQAAAGG